LFKVGKVMDVTKLHNWHDIKWLDVELTVKQLRGQIFLASRSHEYKAVGNLQKTMLRSSANLLLSVRRVTQVNKGRSTPGVDKKVYETPAERLALAKEVADLRLNDWQPPPTKRVLIPKKKGKKAKRPAWDPDISFILHLILMVFGI
jgi:RNA-directed DNA polymerase